MPIAQGGTAVLLTNDYDLEVSRQNVHGYRSLHRFGANPSVAASSIEVVSRQGTMGGLAITTPVAVRIKAGGHAADSATGTGLRSIMVSGLDHNWLRATETLVTAGTAASAPTTTRFARVFRIFGSTSGTNSGIGPVGTNVGDITLEAVTGGAPLLVIVAGRGESEYSGVTVPSDCTVFLTSYAIDVSPGKALSLTLYRRDNADMATAPFGAKRAVLSHTDIEGQFVLPLRSYIRLLPKTDLWWEAENGSGKTGACSVAYDLILVDN